MSSSSCKYNVQGSYVCGNGGDLIEGFESNAKNHKDRFRAYAFAESLGGDLTGGVLKRTKDHESDEAFLNHCAQKCLEGMPMQPPCKGFTMDGSHKKEWCALKSAMSIPQFSRTSNMNYLLDEGSAWRALDGKMFANAGYENTKGSLGECRQRCDNTAMCVGINYDPRGQQCELYGTQGLSVVGARNGKQGYTRFASM